MSFDLGTNILIEGGALKGVGLVLVKEYDEFYSSSPGPDLRFALVINY